MQCILFGVLFLCGCFFIIYFHTSNAHIIHSIKSQLSYCYSVVYCLLLALPYHVYGMFYSLSFTLLCWNYFSIINEQRYCGWTVSCENLLKQIIALINKSFCVCFFVISNQKWNMDFLFDLNTKFNWFFSSEKSFYFFYSIFSLFDISYSNRTKIFFKIKNIWMEIFIKLFFIIFMFLSISAKQGQRFLQVKSITVKMLK